MIKIGKVSFNPEAFKGYTKEQFFNEYAGKLEVDKSVVWGLICKVNDLNKVPTFEEIKSVAENVIEKKNESIGSTGKQSKRTKRK